MNRFYILCGIASLLALIAIGVSRISTDESITLHSSEWNCVNTMPIGLHAECTEYTRKVKQQARAN